MENLSLSSMKKSNDPGEMKTAAGLPIERMSVLEGVKSWRDLVLIVAFNDAAYLPSLIRETRAALPGADILVVDDGSVDGSGKAAEKAGAMVIRHPFKMGMGRSLQSGYRFALTHCCQRLVQMDSRGADSPQDAAALLDRLRQEDVQVAIGSRFLRTSGSQSTGLLERVASSSASTATALLTGQRFSDPTSSLRAVSRKVFPLLCKEGFPHDCPDAGLLALVGRAGYRVVEAPIAASQRSSGTKSGLKWALYPVRMLVSLLVLSASQPTKRPVHPAEMPAAFPAHATAPAFLERTLQ
ncbi:MAG: glycosyltransferase family 2 protein [Armatimonadota bacterium]|nr:glycosyltransferase family 2 protein [Armatimonadota bacterium]